MKKTTLITLATGAFIIFLLLFSWVNRTVQAPEKKTAQQNSIITKKPTETTSTVPADSQESGFKILNAPTVESDRSALLPGNHDDDPSVCEAKYSELPANTTFTYSSRERGITFEVPYNKFWGSKTYYLPPFVEAIEDGPKLFFGNIAVNFEGGCGLSRQYIMYFLPPKNTDEELQAAEKWDSSTTPTKKIINNLEVVEFQVAPGDYCNALSQYAVVIGKKFNYFFWTPCGGSLSGLERIIKTVKLIE